MSLFLEAQPPNTQVCQPVCLPVPVTFIVVNRRRQSSYDVARLHLTAPIEFWQNSTPVFGVTEATFDGRRPLMDDTL